jgi:hypothetical protein
MEREKSSSATNLGRVNHLGTEVGNEVGNQIRSSGTIRTGLLMGFVGLLLSGGWSLAAPALNSQRDSSPSRFASRPDQSSLPGADVRTPTEPPRFDPNTPAAIKPADVKLSVLPGDNDGAGLTRTPTEPITPPIAGAAPPAADVPRGARPPSADAGRLGEDPADPYTSTPAAYASGTDGAANGAANAPVPTAPARGPVDRSAPPPAGPRNAAPPVAPIDRLR